MGLCLGELKEQKDASPFIIDVQQVIADAAWKLFYRSLSWWEKRGIRRKDFNIEVPMNYYHFEETKQELRPKTIGVRSSGLPASNTGKKGLSGTDKKLLHPERAGPEHLGLETEFRNSTGESQKYNFRFEKTRRAAITVNYQKGFSFGNNTSFSIGLPKVLADGKLSNETTVHLEVSKTTEQTFEETLTTSVTSDITVAPYSHCTASVVMEERIFQAEFTVWVTMSMPAKKAKVFIRDKKDKVVFYYTLPNLETRFPNNTIKDDQGNDRQDAVEFEVKGIVHGLQLSNHQINLDSHDLVSPAASSADKPTSTISKQM